MSLIEWWCDLSRRQRYLFSAVLLGISTALLASGTIWIWGWAVGGVLLLCTLFGVGED